MKIPQLTSHSTVKKRKGFSSKIKNKAEILTFYTAIHHNKEIPSQNNQANKRIKNKNKRHINWKGESKITFADEITMYVENPKYSIYTKKLPNK